LKKDKRSLLFVNKKKQKNFVGFGSVGIGNKRVVFSHYRRFDMFFSG